MGFPESRSAALLTSAAAVDKLESETLSLRHPRVLDFHQTAALIERRANGVVPICYPNHGYV